MASVRSPDGREWKVTASRFRMPPWRSVDYDADDWDTGFVNVVAEIVLFVVCSLAIPLVVAIFEVPVRGAVSLFSRTRYVVARARWPNEFEIVFETTARHADETKAHVIEKLSHGYAELETPKAELVHVTRPHWIDER